VASIPDPPGHGEEIAGPEGGGEYEVGAVLREGWGGTIRAGRYLRTGRQVTVQDVRADLAAMPGLVDRLAELGRVTSLVRDPHLLGVYDLAGGTSGLRLIAEWSDAPPLDAAVRRGSLSAERAVAIVDDVLGGLVALHSTGLFHGHVGRDTVVLEADGRARLAELAVCAAAVEGGGPETDVTEAARLGLHLLRRGGRRLDALRRPLDSAVAGAGDAARLRQELDVGAIAVLGAGWRDRPTAMTSHPRRRWRRVLLALLVALAAAGGAVAAALLTGGHRVTVVPGPLALGSDARLAVAPQSAGCNTTFVFVGRGSLSGVGTLVYRWEQSDGQVSANSSLPIGADVGAFRLTQAWRLEGTQTVNGAMTLHILKPVDRSISQSFHYVCR
jgi:hypothetical protein